MIAGWGSGPNDRFFVCVGVEFLKLPGDFMKVPVSWPKNSHKKPVLNILDF